MSELSPDARDLIAEARKLRSELGPSPQQRAQLRAQLAPLWAADALPPRAAKRVRWKAGVSALLAGLGLLGSLYSRPSSELPLASGPRAPAANPSSSATAADKQPPLTLDDPATTPASAAPDTACSASAGGPCAAAPSNDTSPALPCATAAGPSAACNAALVPSSREAVAAKSACAPGVDAHCPARGLPLKAATTRRPKRAAAAPASRQTTEPAAAAPASGQTTELAAVAPAERMPASSAHEPASLRGPRHASRVHSASASAPLTAAVERTPERAVRTDTDPGPPSIEGELELLGAAQHALQKQRPSRALSMLQEHAFRFPKGAMVEERMAMQALALCSLGRRHAAQTVLANLAARGAPSQLLPRVRSQCGL